MNLALKNMLPFSCTANYLKSYVSLTSGMSTCYAIDHATSGADDDPENSVYRYKTKCHGFFSLRETIFHSLPQTQVGWSDLPKTGALDMVQSTSGLWFHRGNVSTLSRHI